MNLLDISSKYLSLEPDKLLRANKVYEHVLKMYEDTDDGIEYIKENLTGRSLDYALELLEAQSSYMGTPIYFQNGKFSAPRLALYGYESRPLLKTKIREKIGKSNELEKKSKELKKSVKKEEVEISEKIDVGADAGATIKDFVHSKAKTFKGDTKKERIKRALGAYYGAKNEDKDPCWQGYTQVGMKKKGGKDVPNCVPSKGVEKAKGYKKEEFEDLDEVYGRYGRRQTAGGRYVPRDEPDEDEQVRQSDAIQAKLRAQKAKQQSSAGKERLKSKGAVPTKNGKPVFEGVEIDENLELFVRYAFDAEIVENIDEMNELLTVITEEDYNYLVNEAMTTVAPNQQQKPQQQSGTQPQRPTPTVAPSPVRPNPQQAQQNSPAPQQQTTTTTPQKPQPTQQQKRPVAGMAKEEKDNMPTMKKGNVVINPRIDQDMTAGEKTSDDKKKKTVDKLKEQFSLNIDKDSVLSKFINIK
jgi:hypothetical protein